MSSKSYESCKQHGQALTDVLGVNCTSPPLSSFKVSPRLCRNLVISQFHKFAKGQRRPATILISSHFARFFLFMVAVLTAVLPCIFSIDGKEMNKHLQSIFFRGNWTLCDGQLQQQIIISIDVLSLQKLVSCRNKELYPEVTSYSGSSVIKICYILGEKVFFETLKEQVFKNWSFILKTNRRQCIIGVTTNCCLLQLLLAGQHSQPSSKWNQSFKHCLHRSF